MRDQGKTTRSTKFVSAMEKLFNLHAERAKAYNNKEEARQKIVESMGKKANTGTKNLQERIDIELIAFENTDIGQIFKKTPDFDFEATTKANREKALSAIRDFQITGQVTNDLADMLRSYALRPAYDKEREFLVQNYVKLGTAVQTLLKEKEELQRRVHSLRGEGREVTPSVTGKSNGTKTGYSARDILGQDWEKVFDR